MSIVVFGSINFDLTTYVPHLPMLGETLRGHSFITVPGGKGANQAVAASRLGASTYFIGRIGDDGFGHEVMPIIKKEGVDISQVKVDKDHGTGLAVISVDDKADNSIILISGANMAVDKSDVQRCIPLLDNDKVLLLQLEVPLEMDLTVAREARKRNVKVILDPAPAFELPLDAYQLSDIMTPNETEARMLVGFQPANAIEAEKAASIIHERGVNTVIIKLGALGVYYYLSNSENGFIPAFKVKSVDTVAAGDAFNAGLAVALSEGKPILEAIRWGCAAGAIATTKPGAMPSMPFRRELEKLLKEGKTYE
jgi:ribokinase